RRRYRVARRRHGYLLGCLCAYRNSERRRCAERREADLSAEPLAQKTRLEYFSLIPFDALGNLPTVQISRAARVPAPSRKLTQHAHRGMVLTVRERVHAETPVTRTPARRRGSRCHNTAHK